MPTPATETTPGGLGARAKEVAEHASALVRLELELAALELKQKVTRARDRHRARRRRRARRALRARLPVRDDRGRARDRSSTWLALLIVTLVLLLARRDPRPARPTTAIKKGTPPVPEQAIREAKLTTEALKSNGHEQQPHRPSRSAARSRPSASSSPARSTSCATRSARRPTSARSCARSSVVAAGALGAGILPRRAASARRCACLARRGREGTTKARFGRFSVVDRD